MRAVDVWLVDHLAVALADVRAGFTGGNFVRAVQPASRFDERDNADFAARPMAHGLRNVGSFGLGDDDPTQPGQPRELGDV